MLFKKVNKEHKLRGVKDFEEKVVPNEFGQSSTTDQFFDTK